MFSTWGGLATLTQSSRHNGLVDRATLPMEGVLRFVLRESADFYTPVTQDTPI